MEIPITEMTFGYAITYLLLYRLSVMVLGGVSIYLGYRLFTKAIPDQKSLDANNEGAELQVQIGEHQLSLKNAAPGIFFAVFGALITIIILATSPPEFNFNPKTGEVTVRSEETVPETVEDLYRASVKKQQSALYYMKRAVSIAPNNSAYYELLAGLYFVDKDLDEAVQIQRKAIDSASGQDDKALMQRYLAAYETALE